VPLAEGEGEVEGLPVGDAEAVAVAPAAAPRTGGLGVEDCDTVALRVAAGVAVPRAFEGVPVADTDALPEVQGEGEGVSDWRAVPDGEYVAEGECEPLGEPLGERETRGVPVMVKAGVVGTGERETEGEVEGEALMEGDAEALREG
jgi:hypothetical protein